MSTYPIMEKLATQSEVIPNQATNNTISAMDNKRTTTESGVATGQPFELMKLPAEVRRMIFKEFLVMPGPINSHSWVLFEGGARARVQAYTVIKRTDEENPQTPLLQIPFKETDIIRQSSRLNLFLASKTIYFETLPLYFGHNIFFFNSGRSFVRFANAIGPDSRRQLARVELRWSGSCAQATKTLTKCVRLRELSLYIAYIYNSSSDPDLHGWPSGMGDLLRVRGLETLNLYHLRGCDKPTCPGRKVIDGVQAECPSFNAAKKALEVMKQPRDAKRLKIQEAKGFNFMANVTTRSVSRKLVARKKMRASAPQASANTYE